MICDMAKYYLETILISMGFLKYFQGNAYTDWNNGEDNKVNADFIYNFQKMQKQAWWLHLHCICEGLPFPVEQK